MTQLYSRLGERQVAVAEVERCRLNSQDPRPAIGLRGRDVPRPGGRRGETGATGSPRSLLSPFSSRRPADLALPTRGRGASCRPLGGRDLQGVVVVVGTRARHAAEPRPDASGARSRPGIRRLAALVAAAVGAALLVTLPAQTAGAASQLIAESFTGTSVADAAWKPLGSACLTRATSAPASGTSTLGVCSSRTSAPASATTPGALQLTDTRASAVGGACTTTRSRRPAASTSSSTSTSTGALVRWRRRHRLLPHRRLRAA